MGKPLAKRSVNIAELKNRLSAYLDRVRQGEEIVIRDRKKPIAKIVPLSLDDYSAEEQELIARGLMRPAERPLPDDFWDMPAPRVPLKVLIDAVIAERQEDR